MARKKATKAARPKDTVIEQEVLLAEEPLLEVTPEVTALERPLPAEAATDVPFSEPIRPSRIYKYAKRRGLTLQQVLDVCPALGIDQAHRHRDITPADIVALDAHFFGGGISAAG